MKNILTENKLVKNLRAYPVLHKRWRGYIQGVRELPEGFTAELLEMDERSSQVPVAPAEGLNLVGVDYPDASELTARAAETRVVREL